MDAIALFFTKFSEELLMAQMAMLFAALSIATYWMLVRKKKRESAEWVPAALVRAYLDRVRAEEADIRFKLFGEATTAPAPGVAAMTSVTAAITPQQVVVNGSDPALAKEVEALRAQLTLADQRSIEFDRLMNGLKAEKSALEQKLKDAQTAAAAGAPASGAAPAEAVQKELDDLRAKLQEYSVIEDDLANLKKFQKENETLRQKVESYEKGGAPAMTVIQGGASEAPAPEAVVKNVTEKIETPVTVISGGEAPQEAQNSAPVETAPVPETKAASPEVNTNVLEPVAPTVDTGTPAPTAEAAPSTAPTEPAAPSEATAPAAAAAPEPEKSAKQKEEELLSEFEKMLAS